MINSKDEEVKKKFTEINKKVLTSLVYCSKLQTGGEKMNNKIEEIRTSLKMSQAELAKTSKVSRTVISQLENGTRKTITSETMLKLSRALGRPVEEIFLF